MFDSLSNWLTLECLIRKYKGRNIAGDVSYSEPESCKCTREDKIVKVINQQGEYDLSTIQLFVCREDVTTDDCVIVDGIERPVKGVSKMFDFNTGKFSLAVLYL